MRAANATGRSTLFLAKVVGKAGWTVAKPVGRHTGKLAVRGGMVPRIPVSGEFQVISGSNQIDSESRSFNAVFYEGQLLVLFFVSDQLLISASYHAGFMQ